MCTSVVALPLSYIKFYKEEISMENKEEKIKAFFSSDENIKKLMDNEEFMNRISDGTADPETYQSQFKKLGLDLNDEEATQTAEMTNKLLNTPPEKLKDISLENVTGGHNCAVEATYLGAIAGSVLSLPGLATTAAAIVCRVKSRKYEKSGDTQKALDYAKASNTLGAISGIILPVLLLTAVTCVPSVVEHEIHQAKQRKQLNDSYKHK